MQAAFARQTTDDPEAALTSYLALAEKGVRNGRSRRTDGDNLNRLPSLGCSPSSRQSSD